MMIARDARRAAVVPHHDGAAAVVIVDGPLLGARVLLARSLALGGRRDGEAFTFLSERVGVLVAKLLAACQAARASRVIVERVDGFGPLAPFDVQLATWIAGEVRNAFSAAGIESSEARGGWRARAVLPAVRQALPLWEDTTPALIGAAALLASDAVRP
jgi:hypothetical protein